MPLNTPSIQDNFQRDIIKPAHKMMPHLKLPLQPMTHTRPSSRWSSIPWLIKGKWGQSGWKNHSKMSLWPTKSLAKSIYKGSGMTAPCRHHQPVCQVDSNPAGVNTHNKILVASFASILPWAARILEIQPAHLQPHLNITGRPPQSQGLAHVSAWHWWNVTLWF